MPSTLEHGEAATRTELDNNRHQRSVHLAFPVLEPLGTEQLWVLASSEQFLDLPELLEAQGRLSEDELLRIDPEGDHGIPEGARVGRAHARYRVNRGGGAP